MGRRRLFWAPCPGSVVFCTMPLPFSTPPLRSARGFRGRVDNDGLSAAGGSHLIRASAIVSERTCSKSCCEAVSRAGRSRSCRRLVLRSSSLGWHDGHDGGGAVCIRTVLARAL